jgi:hypothetical protein
MKFADRNDLAALRKLADGKPHDDGEMNQNDRLMAASWRIYHAGLASIDTLGMWQITPAGRRRLEES